MRQFAWRFAAVTLFLASLTVVGTAGYALIEGVPLRDALYMTAITLATVGYSEVFPLSQGGRNFTMLLLLGGFAWMGLWFALITSLIVELDLRQTFWKRRIMKAIERMSDHVIICGAGQSGQQVAEELTAMGQDYVVIENDAEHVENLGEQDPNMRIIQGNATTDHSLEEAGIDRAAALVANVSDDSDNLVICLSARGLNPKLLIVARAREEEAIAKMYRAGANKVISPNVSGALQMASLILRPGVLSFLDVATSSSGISLRFEEVTVQEGSDLAGRTLADARIPEETGLLVIAVRKTNEGKVEEFVFNPVADTLLDPGDQVIVMGRPEQVRNLKTYVSN